MSDPILTDCPECGKSTYVKQVTAAGFQLKGSGWYVTDFRDGGRNPAADLKAALPAIRPPRRRPARLPPLPRLPPRQPQPDTHGVPKASDFSEAFGLIRRHQQIQQYGALLHAYLLHRRGQSRTTGPDSDIVWLGAPASRSWWRHFYRLA